MISKICSGPFCPDRVKTLRLQTGILVNYQLQQFLLGELMRDCVNMGPIAEANIPHVARDDVNKPLTVIYKRGQKYFSTMARKTT